LHEERQLIAHELHDEFAQSVTAIRTLAVVVASQSSGDARVAEAAQLISAEAGRLYDAMHGLIPRLAPLALDTMSLAETLEGFVNEWRRRHASASFELRHDLSTEIGASISLAVYRIVQEGVTNAVRHANAKQIDIEVRAEADRVVVRIEDDGVGLPENWAKLGHFGLRGLHERIAKLEGSFDVNNRSGGGVVLSATIPLGVTS
jgi:two-component system, NarL family, sensor histidine kinase UhpB